MAENRTPRNDWPHAVLAAAAAADDGEDGAAMDGARALHESRRKRTRCADSAERQQQLDDAQQHVLDQCQQRVRLRRLGCVNERDPLTGDTLDAQRPLTLLVNEQTGELTGFDLFSLYNIHIRKGRQRFKTLDGGRFALQPEEAHLIARDFADYYGHS